MVEAKSGGHGQQSSANYMPAARLLKRYDSSLNTYQVKNKWNIYLFQQVALQHYKQFFGNLKKKEDSSVVSLVSMQSFTGKNKGIRSGSMWGTVFNVTVSDISN